MYFYPSLYVSLKYRSIINRIFDVNVQYITTNLHSSYNFDQNNVVDIYFILSKRTEIIRLLNSFEQSKNYY